MQFYSMGLATDGWPLLLKVGTRMNEAKTEFVLVFIEKEDFKFVFLTMPDKKGEIFHIASFDGDPLAYIGVPKEIRQHIKVESATKSMTISQNLKATTERFIQDKTIKNVNHKVVTVIGTKDNIKIIDECLGRFWATELVAGDYSPEELEAQWNIE